MAQRRMFSLRITDTDKFMAMPGTARLLYYELGQRADDDGFVDSPMKILKMIGCAIDDFKVLCGKQYIIPFESGVCVIRDWRIHNYIQNDRKHGTQYKDELNTLTLDGNGAYNVDTKCIQPVSRMDSEVRLGKVREGEVKKEKKETPAPPKPPTPAGCSIFKSKAKSPLIRACGLFKARSWCFQDKDECQMWGLYNSAIAHLKSVGLPENDTQYFGALTNQVKQRMDKDAERLSSWANKMHTGVKA